ncbi:hypothetical protein D3C81_2208790 [compost metagenome]
MCCILGDAGQISGTMIALMGLCIGIGLAIGFSLLAGSFYLIWRFIRVFERNMGK